MGRKAPAPKTVPFEDVAFRYSNYDTPFWVRPNSEGGRWHRSGDGPTQYLSTTVEGAWSELIRAEGLRSELEVSLVRMPIWVAELNVQRVADYSTFEAAHEAGFAPHALVDDDYSRCQEEGLRLRSAGFQGVLAPSAALPGAINLTIFGPRIASNWNREPLLASSIPAIQMAVGAPPQGIVERVRQLGEPHSGLRQYQKEIQPRRRRADEG